MRNNLTVNTVYEELPRPIRLAKDIKAWGNWITGNGTQDRPSFLGKLDEEAQDFMLTIADNHHRWDATKTVDSIEVVPDSFGSYNNVMFYFTDGTREQFGINSMLKKRTPKQRFLAACRGEVVKRHGRGNTEYHLDHSGAYPFSRIVDMYLENKDLDRLCQGITSVQAYENTKGDMYCLDSDDFIEFHDKYAKLELIPARDNLVKGNRHD